MPAFIAEILTSFCVAAKPVVYHAESSPLSVFHLERDFLHSTSIDLCVEASPRNTEDANKLLLRARALIHYS